MNSSLQEPSVNSENTNDDIQIEHLINSPGVYYQTFSKTASGKCYKNVPRPFDTKENLNVCSYY